jgi:hypothetical protein
VVEAAVDGHNDADRSSSRRREEAMILGENFMVVL